MNGVRLAICLLWIGVLGFLARGQDSGVPESGYTPATVRRAFEIAQETLNQGQRDYGYAYSVTGGTAGGAAGGAGAGVSPSTSMHRLFQRSNARTRQGTNAQQIFEVATNVLSSAYGVSSEMMRTGQQQTALRSILTGDASYMLQQCETMKNTSICDVYSRYRTIDGTCNNLNNPTWGMAGSCFERLLGPAYADARSGPRIARSGRPLPNARSISLNIHSHFDNPTDYTTHMFMQWGQFLDHDISLSPLNSDGDNNQPPTCCPPGPGTHAECLPIVLQVDDPFFSTFNITCLENVRTEACSTCILGPRQQINQLTAFIDASEVYDINMTESMALRALDGTGRLRSQRNNIAGELLPESGTPQNDECSFQDPNFNCFLGGDSRTNQHPALTSLHILFLREHNRIAGRLRQINPAWNDERLYQETRRIVGAEMQMITYDEFLPLVIGKERMQRFGLFVSDRGYTQYDRSAQPTLLNEFSTAAFRFGHSTINGYFAERSSDVDSNYLLRDMFLFPFGLYRGQMERVLLGLTQSPGQKFDRNMVRDVTNHLYQRRGSMNGLDLASLNILRGRDHGLPGYVQYVSFCGGRRITRFGDLDLLFRPGYRQYFERIYESVEDIDLFSGGLGERPLPGAVVGPTFACIIETQFRLLKFGDRFYFEHGGQAGSFTPQQLAELRKITLGKVMCDNSEITRIQKRVMLYHHSHSNPMVDCNFRPAMNLNAWME